MKENPTNTETKDPSSNSDTETEDSVQVKEVEITFEQPEDAWDLVVHTEKAQGTHSSFVGLHLDTPDECPDALLESGSETEDDATLPQTQPDTSSPICNSVPSEFMSDDISIDSNSSQTSVPDTQNSTVFGEQQ